LACLISASRILSISTFSFFELFSLANQPLFSHIDAT
jgi:hypothetical protein